MRDQDHLRAAGTGSAPGEGEAAGEEQGADLAIRIIVESDFAEVVGAVLMDSLGSFAEESVGAATSALVFYPQAGGLLGDDELLKPLGPELRAASSARVERKEVPRDWVDGWKDHFYPVLIGAVRVRPPWESAFAAADSRRTGCGGRHRKGTGDGSELVEVVINPGLGFGTGQHPTTKGTLRLLQRSVRTGASIDGLPGPLTDAGTGSGILAIAAAKMGWAPIVAFDVDPAAVASARDNVAANGVADRVQVWEAGVADAPPEWFKEATVLANMTLEPVLDLLQRWAPGLATSSLGSRERPGRRVAKLGRPRRLVVSGILAGSQESQLVLEAERCGFAPGERLYEAEWVSMELLPADQDAASEVRDLTGTNKRTKRA